jgi:hypothetical protein
MVGKCIFSHDAVANRFGFDLLREGQRLDYTLEMGPFLRAVSVRSPKQGKQNRRPCGMHVSDCVEKVIQ